MPTLVWPFAGGITYDYFGFSTAFRFYIGVKIFAILLLLKGSLASNFILILAGQVTFYTSLNLMLTAIFGALLAYFHNRPFLKFALMSTLVTGKIVKEVFLYMTSFVIDDFGFEKPLLYPVMIIIVTSFFEIILGGYLGVLDEKGKNAERHIFIMKK